MSDSQEPETAQERGNRLRLSEARAAKRRKVGAAIIALVALGAISAAILAFELKPRSGRHRALKVAIGRGSAGAALQEAGLVRSGWAFDLYAHWRGDDARFIPGRYTLSPTMTPSQIIRQLHLGPGHSPDDVVRIAVPEGFTIKQIAARLEKMGVADGAAFLQLALTPNRQTQWTVDFPRPPGSLEGYLYPDTYEFLPNTAAEKVLDAMVLNFSRRFSRPYQQQIRARGRSLHQIVTIASLIEREAKMQEDRARVAGVLENRLKKGMKLEIDATVLYALGHHKQRVYFKDLLIDSPYNTYRHAGLPPGPIANPGAQSLQAALAPERNTFLYYVARPNGYHYFTRTAKEHAAAVRQARSEYGGAGSLEPAPGGKLHEPKR